MLENRIHSPRYSIPEWNADLSAVPGADIVSIFGARIANLPYAPGLEIVVRLLESRVAALASDPARTGSATLFFCNANTLTFGQRDRSYVDLLNGADLLYGDGTGVRLAAAMRGTFMKANLNGTDLVPDLLSAREGRGERVFILGGEEAANKTAADYFQAHYPGLALAGRHHGFLSDQDDPDLVRLINEAQPTLLLVGMGHPRQEQWISAHAAQLRVPLTIAVGGLFAYWGNGLRRASSLARQLGFEWFEIMMQQPHKMQRYLLGGPQFLAAAALAAPSDLAIMRASAGR